METADVIVIGSGQGGVPLAADFAKAGQNVLPLLAINEQSMALI